MTRIVVAGAAGKMGTMIIEAAQAVPGTKVVGGLETKGNPACGKTGAHGIAVSSDTAIIKECDVLIDFTIPEGSVQNIGVAAEYGKPAVVGTTGFNPSQLAGIRSASKKIPIVLSPNMSTGVNLLFELVRTAARVLKGYDMEVVEIHHNRKKDAPSGTAVKIVSILSEVSGQKDVCYGRHGSTGERPAGQIGVHSVRAGDVIGEHTVTFAGPGERVELVHRAHSRGTFAAGAVRAARWIVGRKPGLYEMKDVLGER